MYCAWHFKFEKPTSQLSLWLRFLMTALTWFGHFSVKISCNISVKLTRAPFRTVRLCQDENTHHWSKSGLIWICWIRPAGFYNAQPSLSSRPVWTSGHFQQFVTSGLSLASLLNLFHTVCMEQHLWLEYSTRRVTCLFKWPCVNNNTWSDCVETVFNVNYQLTLQSFIGSAWSVWLQVFRPTIHHLLSSTPQTDSQRLVVNAVTDSALLPSSGLKQ